MITWRARVYNLRDTTPATTYRTNRGKSGTRRSPVAHHARWLAAHHSRPAATGWLPTARPNAIRGLGDLLLWACWRSSSLLRSVGNGRHQPGKGVNWVDRPV